MCIDGSRVFDRFAFVAEMVARKRRTDHDLDLPIDRLDLPDLLDRLDPDLLNRSSRSRSSKSIV